MKMRGGSDTGKWKGEPRVAGGDCDQDAEYEGRGDNVILRKCRNITVNMLDFIVVLR